VELIIFIRRVALLTKLAEDIQRYALDG